ncbi:MAG: tautomerase family protein [Actinobacteria bacterium]|nr:MAG: tautomerase family protein [Actinomycetota bacterium]
MDRTSAAMFCLLNAGSPPSSTVRRIAPSGVRPCRRASEWRAEEYDRNPETEEREVPIVRVDIVGPKDAEYVSAVLAAVRGGVVSGIGAPDDRVTVRVIETPASHVDLPSCRSDRYTVVEIALFEGRTPELKAAAMDAVRANLASALAIPGSEVAVVFNDCAPCDLSAPAGEQSA